MTHPFELTHEIEVDATAEEVWEAIATGPGVDAWFMGKNEIEPREGGRVHTELPGVGFDSTVTAWEPPTRFATRSPEGEDGSLHAFEYLIEGRGGGSTVVRWVHSGFLGEDWEAEYEGLSEGDPMYFDKLAQYLRYFRGRIATPVSAFGPQVKDRERVWDVFAAALGVPRQVAVGDAVRMAPEGFSAQDGVIDYRSPSFLGVRTEDGLYRFIHGYETTVGLGHHIYVDALDQAETEAAWQAWLQKTFA